MYDVKFAYPKWWTFDGTKTLVSVVKTIFSLITDYHKHLVWLLRGVLHPEMTDILFFNIKIFLQFTFQICAYT